WSALEILAHLADEEIEDFRLRLRLTIQEPSAHWPPVDPVSWVIERDCNSMNPGVVLERFAAERMESVKWLRALAEIDWTCERTHPAFGTMRAGDLLVAWVCHDALHLRQLSQRVWQIAQAHAPEFKGDYAGSW